MACGSYTQEWAIQAQTLVAGAAIAGAGLTSHFRFQITLPRTSSGGLALFAQKYCEHLSLGVLSWVCHGLMFQVGKARSPNIMESS